MPLWMPRSDVLVDRWKQMRKGIKAMVLSMFPLIVYFSQYSRHFINRPLPNKPLCFVVAFWGWHPHGPRSSMVVAFTDGLSQNVVFPRLWANMPWTNVPCLFITRLVCFPNICRLPWEIIKSRCRTLSPASSITSTIAIHWAPQNTDYDFDQVSQSQRNLYIKSMRTHRQNYTFSKIKWNKNLLFVC